MPNHCSNLLEISGPDIDSVRTQISSEHGLLDFNKIIPYPQKFAQKDLLAEQFRQANLKTRNRMRKELGLGKNDTVSDGFNTGGYDWCLKHWQTKWNAYDQELVYEGLRSLKISFFTAWSPPINVIYVMSKMFKNNTFRLSYWECGCGFKGAVKFRFGRKISSKDGEYHGSRGG